MITEGGGGAKFWSSVAGCPYTLAFDQGHQKRDLLLLAFRSANIRMQPG